MSADAIHSTSTAGLPYSVRPTDELADKEVSFLFGSFEVIPESRTLTRKNIPVEIGGRAFDLLMTLLLARGRIVSKEAIMREVWPTTTVDESNVRFQMTCLRRALGEERERIKTVPGRGYMFIADDPVAREPWLDRVTAPAFTEQPPIVIIDGNPENCELLFSLLAAAGVKVDSLASVAALLGRELTSESGRSLRIVGAAT